MKNRKYAVIVSGLLVLSVGLFAGCANNETVVENATHNQAHAVSSAVNSTELASVSPDEAIDIALRHAGVARENAVLFGTPSLDIEKGIQHYDIEFGYNGFEYDYEISVSDGSVLKAEKEPEMVKASEKEKVSEKAAAPVSGESKANNGYISVEAAKKKALDDAGVKAEDAVFLKAYYDSDDIIPHYDVKFEANRYEYEYEIKASDGSVLEKDVDKERNPVRATLSADDYISSEKAKSIAFEHASVKAADVKFSKAELDRDDLIVHYDVEFVAGKFEYEYEINAETGKVIVFDKEIND